MPLCLELCLLILLQRRVVAHSSLPINYTLPLILTRCLPEYKIDDVICDNHSAGLPRDANLIILNIVTCSLDFNDLLAQFPAASVDMRQYTGFEIHH